jgi:hypothetical protein
MQGQGWGESFRRFEFFTCAASSPEVAILVALRNKGLPYQAIPLPATDFNTPSRLSTGLRYGFLATGGQGLVTGFVSAIGGVSFVAFSFIFAFVPNAYYRARSLGFA